MRLDPATWVALVVAAVSAIGGYFTAARTTRPKDREAETATASSLLASYDAFADRLQEEVERVRHDCQTQIDHVQQQHERDRQEWRRREALLVERVEELESQVVALMSLPERSARSRTRETDAG